MKKRIALLLGLILSLASCDTLIEATLQDGETVVNETEKDTVVIPEVTTEEPTEQDFEEPSEESTSYVIEESTVANTEPITDNAYEETTNQSVSDEEILQELLDRLAADGYDAEQTLLEIVHEMRSITVTAALNGRIFRPGDTVEVSLSNMKYYGEDFIMAPDNGKVTLYPPPGDRLIRMTTEDYVTFTATIPEDTEPGICWIYVFFEGINEMPLCPLIVY